MFHPIFFYDDFLKIKYFFKFLISFGLFNWKKTYWKAYHSTSSKIRHRTCVASCWTNGGAQLPARHAQSAKHGRASQSCRYWCGTWSCPYCWSCCPCCRRSRDSPRRSSRPNHLAHRRNSDPRRGPTEILWQNIRFASKFQKLFRLKWNFIKLENWKYDWLRHTPHANVGFTT